MGNGPDNYTQEECEEGIDRMMSRPTPEETAIHNALLALFCWVYNGHGCPADTEIFKHSRETIDMVIRAAVEAEREACAGRLEAVRDLSIQTMLEIDSGVATLHAEAVYNECIAAIRARGENDAG
jgi:hypothetical protein